MSTGCRSRWRGVSRARPSSSPSRARSGASARISGNAGGGPDAAVVAERLRDALGPFSKRRRDPLDELVLTILSQSTTDANRDRAWDALRERFPEWDDVRLADRRELEEAVRVAGLAGQKAAAIQAALERLDRETGRPSLDHLESMGDDEALDYLSGFEGVGIKTAACVLCFALGRPVLPIDTHVHRVGRRLGWIEARSASRAVHRRLQERVPPEDRFDLHFGLIRLGRRVCRAREARCEACPLADLCPRIGVRDPGPRP